MLTLADKQSETQLNRSATSKMIVTTLYDVIAALNEQVGPEEDDIVTAAVVRLCRSGRLRPLDRSQKDDRCRT